MSNQNERLRVSLARIETKLDALIERGSDHEVRIRVVETDSSKRIGAVGALLSAAAFLISGVAAFYSMLHK